MSELQEVLRAIEAGRDGGERMALATIVGVAGSTYRREGARLLIHENGRLVGTISGGCLEGDVREVAKEVMEDGIPRLLHFDLTADDEVVWGWGLGCNGVIDVFVEPAEGAFQTAAAARQAVEERRQVALATLIEAKNEKGLRLGSRLLVNLDGTFEGRLGDEATQERVVHAAVAALDDERSRTIDPAEGVRVFIEVLAPPLRLLVCGAGHDAIALVRSAAGLGWRVEVLDDREAFLKPRRFPEAARFVKTEPIEAAQQAGIDDRTFVVVMSHNFLRDKDYLRSFLGTDVRYLGMLGPSARLDRLLAELKREGFQPDPAELGVVHGPAGLDLGGDGPDEVAWAIVAEVMAVWNRRAGGFLKDRAGPIHERPREEQAVGPGTA
jgi:xanthine dehydrogenase accessory factor